MNTMILKVSDFPELVKTRIGKSVKLKINAVLKGKGVQGGSEVLEFFVEKASSEGQTRDSVHEVMFQIATNVEQLKQQSSGQKTVV